MKSTIKKEISVISDLKTQELWFKIIKLIAMLGTFLSFALFFDITAAIIWFIFIFICGNIVHFTYRWKTNAWTKSWGKWTILSDEERQPQMLFNFYFIIFWAFTVVLTLVIISIL
ncbi:MAG: hypothetical protein ACFFAE_22730 [Candidatus Hodarchaeota archaeon]